MRAVSAISLAAAIIVSAGALYEAHATHDEICRNFQMAALKAATTPSDPRRNAIMGFTPMDDFNKVYPPACAPSDPGEDTLSALIGGGIAGALCFFGLSLASRILRSPNPKRNHLE